MPLPNTSYNNYTLLTGGTGIYIAKTPVGNDLNNGSPDQPKASLSAIPNVGSDTTIVGTGYYNVTQFTANPISQAIPTIKADGNVIVDLNNNIVPLSAQLQKFYIKNAVWSSATSAAVIVCTDNIYENVTNVTPITDNSGSGFNTRRFINCIFLNSNLLSFRHGIINTNQYTPQFNGCIFFNGAGTFQGRMFVNCYVGSGVTIQLITTNKLTAVPTQTDVYQSAIVNNFANCNINGTVRLPVSGGTGTQDYAIQDAYTGTPQQRGYATGVHWLNEANLTTDLYIGVIAGWNTLVGTLMNRDPKFNDAAARNFTLQANSPHFRAAYGGTSNIGGTNFGLTVLNTDNGISNRIVAANSAINTSAPLAFILKTGSTEGFVDYMFYQAGTASLLRVTSDYYFDSEIAGGGATNNNVPDAEPLTTAYAKKTTASSNGATTRQFISPHNTVANGNIVRINGEIRVVTGGTTGATDTWSVSGATFRATITTGTLITYGTVKQMLTLNPNRLTVLMRTSNNSISSPPAITGTSVWDNNVAGGFGVAGTFFNQTVNQQPGLYITGGVVYGAGDANAPTGISLQQIGNCWIHMRVYLRNNYNVKGL